MSRRSLPGWHCDRRAEPGQKLLAEEMQFAEQASLLGRRKTLGSRVPQKCLPRFYPRQQSGNRLRLPTGRQESLEKVSRNIHEQVSISGVTQCQSEERLAVRPVNGGRCFEREAPSPWPSMHER